MATMNTSEIAPSSALRHRPIGLKTTEISFVTPRASAKLGARTRSQQEVRTTDVPVWTVTKRQQKQQIHWLIPIGLAMAVMILLIWLVQAAWAWGTVTYDDIHYGRPRTMQADAFVGHETGKIPSHFIALNDHGRIEIIELPGGDAAHARIYLGPQIWGTDAELVPITIAFQPSSQQSKLVDMDVSFHGTHLLFRNQKGTFVPPTS